MRRLAESHLVSEYSVYLLLVHEQQPVQANHLIRLEPQRRVEKLRLLLYVARADVTRRCQFVDMRRHLGGYLLAPFHQVKDCLPDLNQLLTVLQRVKAERSLTAKLLLLQ